jgi:hypothetical protein
VDHLGAVFYRFTIPRITIAQKQEKYRKRKKGAEEGSQMPKKSLIVAFYVKFAVQS